ncbi:MAG TPA: tetratricopeptide repeat protein, partial [Thermodesulfovibrionales bacterium]|nr:tetratricopeptide repeat protein [Thermodesulfovibrionales bacterium]
MRRRGFVSVVTVCITVVVLVGVLCALYAPSVSAQEGLYQKGVHAYLKKDYKNAAKSLREYTDQKPDAAAYYLLGYANYKLKNEKEAEEYFREAYLIDPGFTPK